MQKEIDMNRCSSATECSSTTTNICKSETSTFVSYHTAYAFFYFATYLLVPLCTRYCVYDIYDFSNAIRKCPAELRRGVVDDLNPQGRGRRISGRVANTVLGFRLPCSGGVR